MRLRYTVASGAESCPPAREMEALIGASFGYPAVKPDGGPLIEIEMSRPGAEFHARIVITGADGTTLWVSEKREPRRCVDLARLAAEGAVTMTEAALDRIRPRPSESGPDAGALAAPGAAPATMSAVPSGQPAPAQEAMRRCAPEPLPAPAPQPVGHSVVPVSAVAEPPVKLPITYSSGLGAEFTIGMTPGYGAGVGGFATARYGVGSWSAELRYLRSLTATPAGEVSIRGTFFGGALVPCLHRDWASICGTLHVGGRWLDATPPTRRALPGATTAGVGVRFSAEWALSTRWLFLFFAEAARGLAGLRRDEGVSREALPPGPVLLSGLRFTVRM